jgi:hypothetical protein
MHSLLIREGLGFGSRTSVTAPLPSAAGRLFADAEVDGFAAVGKYYAIRFDVFEGGRLHCFTDTDFAVFAF